MNLLFERLRALRPRIVHILRVGAVGGIGFILQTIVFEVLGIQLELLRPSHAVLVGGEIAILSNFFLNERFNFKPSPDSSFITRILRFHAVVFVSVGIQWLFVYTAEHIDATNTLLLRGAYILGVGVGFLTNYLGYMFLVWKDPTKHK